MVKYIRNMKFQDLDWLDIFQTEDSSTLYVKSIGPGTPNDCLSAWNINESHITNFPPFLPVKKIGNLKLVLYKVL